MNNIESRLRSMKAMATMLLKEATIIEKELGLATAPTPRKGLSQKHLEQIHLKSDRSLMRRVAKTRNAKKHE